MILNLHFFPSILLTDIFIGDSCFSLTLNTFDVNASPRSVSTSSSALNFSRYLSQPRECSPRIGRLYNRDHKMLFYSVFCPFGCIMSSSSMFTSLPVPTSWKYTILITRLSTPVILPFYCFRCVHCNSSSAGYTYV